jgi:ferredoxin
MKTIIYYFTGTGNTLKVAKDVASGLGETELVPIQTALGKSLRPDADAVGIAFPVYMWGLPPIVCRFIASLDLKGKYVFAIATYGGMPAGTLRQAQRLISSAGGRLAAGFALKMPGNYIPMYGAVSEQDQAKMFAAKAEKVKRIVTAVKERADHSPDGAGNPLGRLLSGIVYGISAPRIPRMDVSFWSDERCNGCGTCERVCPVANIALADGRPTWRHRCEQCMACIQWCPQEAIQYGKKTAARRRYRNPHATVDEIAGGKSAPAQ